MVVGHYYIIYVGILHCQTRSSHIPGCEVREPVTGHVNVHISDRFVCTGHAFKLLHVSAVRVHLSCCKQKEMKVVGGKKNFASYPSCKVTAGRKPPLSYFIIANFTKKISHKKKITSIYAGLSQENVLNLRVAP